MTRPALQTPDKAYFCWMTKASLLEEFEPLTSEERLGRAGTLC